MVEQQKRMRMRIQLPFASTRSVEKLSLHQPHLASDPKRRMCSLATAFEAGDVIVQEDPWVYTLSPIQARRRCWHCLHLLEKLDAATGQRLPAQRNNQCSGCRFARFCSKECQSVDWKARHKYTCFGLREILTFNHLTPERQLRHLLIAEIIAKLVHPKTDTAAYFGPVAGQRTFADIDSHARIILADPHRDMGAYLKTMRLGICGILQLTAAQMSLVPDPLFVEIYGRVKCEPFRIEGWRLETIGVGVYLQASSFGYSCAPNACQTFVGKRLTLSASMAIESVDKVKYSHIDHLTPTEVRQIQLRRAWHTTCTCTACTDWEMNAARYALPCVNRKCDAAIPLDARLKPSCPKCRAVLPQSRQKVFGEMVHLDANPMMMTFITPGQPDHRPPMSPAAYSELAQFERKLGDVLHPTNAMMPAFYFKIGLYLQSTGDVSAHKYFQTALELYRLWLGPADPRLALCAFFAVDPDAPDEVETLTKLDECRKALVRSFGVDHEIMVEFRLVHKEVAQKLRVRIGGRR